MATMIVPVPPSEPVRVADLRPGDVIADRHEGPWHHVIAVTADSLTVGDPETPGSTIPVTADAVALRLDPAHTPRQWRTVQTPSRDTDKINGGLPGTPDRSTR